MDKYKEATLEKLTLERQLLDKREILLKTNPDFAEYYEIEQRIKNSSRQRK